MLDTIVTGFVAKYNVGKISRKGKIRTIFGEEGPALHFVDVNGKNFPGYVLHFLFDDLGLIRYAGHARDLPTEKVDRYNLGTFLVAVDMGYLAKLAKMNMNTDNIKEERIVKHRCDYSKLKAPETEKVQERIQATKYKYNAQFGFNPDYDGFTVGNFLDDGEVL